MGAIRVRRNFSFSHLRMRPSREAMRSGGYMLAAKIVDRTRNGRDENNKSFAPYSSGGGKVRLTDTGQMLDDLTVLTATETHMGLGFRTQRSARIADYHEQGTKFLPKRRFLGVPKAWVTDLVRLLRSSIRF